LPSIDIITDDDKLRQGSTARIGGSSALMDKVGHVASVSPTKDTMMIVMSLKVCLTEL